MVLISSETALTVSNIRYYLSFCYRHLRDMRWHLIVVSVGIFLMAMKLHSFRVLSGRLVGLVWRNVCRVCLSVCFNRCVAPLLTLRNLVWSRQIFPHQTRHLWVFSPILWHITYLMLVFTYWQKTKRFFYFVSCTFGVISRSHCLSPGHGFTALSSSESFILALFESVISFEVNCFVCGVRRHPAEVFCMWNSIIPASVVKTFSSVE